MGPAEPPLVGERVAVVDEARHAPTEIGEGGELACEAFANAATSLEEPVWHPLHSVIGVQIHDAVQVALLVELDIAVQDLLVIHDSVPSLGSGLLAFDVDQFENPRIREIMAKHGWFQTVLSDLPHFTFLGLKEKDLPKHGLRSLEINGQVFWIPNVSALHPGLDK